MEIHDIIKYINFKRNKQYMKNQADVNCISETIHGVNYFDVSEIVGKNLFNRLVILSKDYNFWHLDQYGYDYAHELMRQTGISSNTLKNWIIKYQNVYVKKENHKISKNNTLFFAF